MHDNKPPQYISQSECSLAQDCGVRWSAPYVHGIRATGNEGPAQVVGSLGHVCVAEHVHAMVEQREPDFNAAMLTEARKRHYLADDAEWSDAGAALWEQAGLAVQAARTLIEDPAFDVRHALIGPDGRLIVEARIRAPWSMADINAGLVLPDAMRQVFLRDARRLGIEGTPDIVHPRGMHATAALYLDDYKMRTRPVDGMTRDNNLPDPQGSFYKVLIRAVGLDDGRRDVVFRQVNVYAGRWHTLEDFLAPGSPYVIASGLPTRDEKALDGMVKAEVWSEAWRHLAERRVSTPHPVTGKYGKPPTFEETDNARRFIDRLRARSTVHVSEWPLDHSVCLEVVRDMLSAVAQRFAALDAGIIGRHLRVYPSAPCVRPWGCDVQSPCLAALGSDNVVATLREHAAQGRLSMLGVVPDIGEHAP